MKGLNRFGVRFLSSILLYFLLNVAVPAAEGPTWLKLSDLSGALTFRFQVVDEEETAGDSLNRDANRRFLEGGLQINTKGSIYHPNLLIFNANVNLVAHRSKDQLFSDPSINNALNNTYNIRLFFLQKKKVNLDLYTISNYSTADRAFLERYFTTYKSTGLTLRTRSKWLPLELDLFTSRMKSESLTYSERNEKTNNINFRVDILKRPRTSSILTVKGKDYDESIFNVQYQSWEAVTNFIHHYGVKDMNTVTSLATYHRMTGYYDLETYDLRVNWTHYLKRNLFLNSIYSLNGDNSFNRSFKRHEGSVGLNHQLFESLTTQLEVGGRFEDSKSRENQAYHGQITFNYIKRIPTGSIQLIYYNRAERSDYVSREDVVNTSEQYDFSLTDSIILTFPGINVDSIRITSDDLSHVYIAGVDYQIDRVGNIITISRLPGGAIPAGQNVLVHYQLLAYPDYLLKTHNYQIHTRLNLLKHFYFFYIKSANHQEIESDYLIPPYEEYDKQVMGAKMVSRFVNLNYTYENYDSSLSDYISHNFRLSGHIKLFHKLRLAANVNINRLTYQPETFYSRFNSYSAECTYNITHTITADALYRKIQYNTPQYDRNRESILFKFQWDFRKIILNVFYERILTTAQVTERGHDFFSIMLRRVF
jgi:hypothetical protein